MSELLSKAKEAVLLWKLAKVKFWLFTLVTLGVAWQSSTSTVSSRSIGLSGSDANDSAQARSTRLGILAASLPG